MEQHGFIFSRSEQRGPQRGTKTDLHATRHPLLPAANLLLWQVSFPNSNLEDFSNLNGICGRSGDTLKTHARAPPCTRARARTRTHTHTSCFSHYLLLARIRAPSREKAASNSNHGDQNTAVSGCQTQSDASDEVSGCFQEEQASTFHSNFAADSDAAVREVIIAAARWASTYYSRVMLSGKGRLLQPSAFHFFSLCADKTQWVGRDGSSG